MRYGTLIKFSFLAIWFVAVVWLGAGPLQAQKRQPEKKPVPSDHANINIARPDKQASDLTSEVASKLSQLGGDQKVVRRTLIDQHLFSAMELTRVPHAPLTNDY